MRAGIPFRIVPGVTAGIGGLAYAGIPVTHRDTNHAVTLVTGHDATGSVAGIDWQAIARATPVIVIYMAMRHLDTISRALLDGGRAPDEPVAIVADAALPGQQVVVTTLGRCVADCHSHDVHPPAVVVVGDVVRLREGLDWLGAKRGRVLDPDPLAASRQDLAG